MDVEDVTISNLRKNSDRNILAVYGSRFTKNAKIFVNGEKVPTNYISSALVTTSLDNVKDGDDQCDGDVYPVDMHMVSTAVFFIESDVE